MSCVLLNVLGDFYISSDKYCFFFGGLYKSEDRMGKRGLYGKESVIAPALLTAGWKRGSF